MCFDGKYIWAYEKILKISRLLTNLLHRGPLKSTSQAAGWAALPYTFHAGYWSLWNQYWKPNNVTTQWVVSTVLVCVYRFPDGFHRVCLTLLAVSTVFVWFNDFPGALSQCDVCVLVRVLFWDSVVLYSFSAVLCYFWLRGFVLTACWQLGVSKSGRSVCCTACSR